MSTLFVTVGSTSFDELIRSVCSESCLKVLVSKGFNQVVLQIGRGTYIPEKSPLLDIKWFDFKDSISDDLKNASLVIGHAGAGTILESLFERTPLIVVLNEQLMDNHQTELAERLAAEGLLKYTTCSSLQKTLEDLNLDDLTKTHRKTEYNVFGEVLHHILGVD